MPRLRHKSNGVVVNVDDDTAKRLGADWEPTDERQQPKRSPRRRAKDSDASSDDNDG